MDKKTFKKITNQCFINQGFTLNGKVLYKENEKLIVNIELDKSRFDDIYYIYAYVWIKDLHQNFSYNTLPNEYDTFGGLRFLENDDKLFSIYYLELESNEYKEKLNILIPKNLNPIFEENIQYLKKSNKFIFSPKVKEYLEKYN